MTLTRGVAVVAALATLVLCPGCQRTPRSIARATAAEHTVKYPQSLQGRTGFPRKAFTIADPQTWERFWGYGEPPPMVDFEKNIVLGVFTSLASEGPGTLEITVTRYRRTEAGMDVKVKELVNGEWPQGVGFARAYDLVVLPRVQGAIRVLWQYKWGARNELREERPEDWNQVVEARSEAGPVQSGWNVQRPGPTSHKPTWAPHQGGWGTIRQPR